METPITYLAAAIAALESNNRDEALRYIALTKIVLGEFVQTHPDHTRHSFNRAHQARILRARKGGAS